MPLVQIHLAEGKTPKYIKAVADCIHEALTSKLKSINLIDYNAEIAIKN